MTDEAAGGSTARFFAAIDDGDAEAVRDQVVANGTLARTRDEDGIRAPLHALYRARRDIAAMLAEVAPPEDAFEAAALGDEERLSAILATDPSAVHSWSVDGFTALHLAAFFGHASAARVLLEAGADPSLLSRNPLAVMPLHSAAAGRAADVVRELVTHGAPIDEPQRHGYTPLLQAAANGDAESVSILLAHGADATRRTDDGQDARALAAASGHHDVIAALEAAPAT
jgi:ankyrin repeat protein